MWVDNLSDVELRSKLMEYGYPVGPVTQTTRKILVKKLKNLVETRGLTGSRHSLAARYSSDETDEDALKTTTVRKKKATSTTRRQTLANPMPPPATVSVPSNTNVLKSPQKDKSSTLNVDVTNSTAAEQSQDSDLPSRSVSRSTQKKYTKTYKSSTITDGLETGSDSDVREESSSYSQTKYLGNLAKPHSFDIHGEHTSVDDPILKSYEPKIRSVHTLKDTKYNEPFKSYSSTSQVGKEDSSSGRDNRDILGDYDTPFLSEFTRRLSSRASMNLPSTSLSSMNPSLRYAPSISSEVKDKDSNGHFSSLRSFYPTSTSSTRPVVSGDRSRDIIGKSFKSTSTGKEDMRNNQNFVSAILVIVLALFFGILAIIYLGLGGKSETFPTLSTDSEIPLCFVGAPDLKAPGVNCLMKENVESVLQLLKRLHPILLKKAVFALCDNSSEIPYLTDSEITKMFTNNKMTSLEVKEDLQSAQLLIVRNPHWGISLVDVSDDDRVPGEVLDTLDKLFTARVNGKIGMLISNPELPLQCHVKNKLFTIFSTLLIISSGILAIIGTQKLFVWYKRYKKSQEREVFGLVSEIINAVGQHHHNAGLTASGTQQDTFVAINHVRDNLIPPKDRKRMAALWEKAVKFLDENESRIRREVQQVAGEEFHVWRWLPNNALNKSITQISSSKKSKVWQGQAFETMEGSVNSPAYSPTPCLKVRHMFDPDVENDDNWEIKIQDAILEKCGDDVKILDIRVDCASREGCVYMKCMSQEDAGKAFRALHGWWFDGHLITVKYLRLERYHERYQDSIHCKTPLKPSNNKRLSMQSHYWQSPMEAN